MAQIALRPSDDRRAALRQAEGEMDAQVSNFFPIERYYNAAEKVFESFNKAYNEKRLDDAYVLGKRFATFSLQGLPHHDYYRSSKYASLQKKNRNQVTNVLAKLEQVADWMDEEEAEREQLRQEYRKKVQEQRKKLEAERVRQQEEIEKARYKELQERVEQQRKKSQRGSSDNVEESAMSKLQLLTQSMPEAPSQEPGRPSKSTGSIVSPQNDSERTGLGERAASSRLRRSRWQQDEGGSSIDAPGSHLGGDEALPPPIPPPSSLDETPPPPSYSQAMSEHDKLVAHRRPQISNGDGPVQRTVAAPAGGAIVGPESDLVSFPEPPSDLPPPPPYSFYDRDSKRMKAPKVAPPARVPMRKLKEQSTADFARLKKMRKIEVFGLGTYQGRNRNSTNGCAVISPLVVSRHLNSSGSVSDAAIVNVIDKECPPLLREIRRKLELEGDALIIPSDVHDHLVDKKILSQSKFTGACGGNILDETHIGEFLRLLEGGETGEHKMKKTGAAFFFHEHVVSIVKVPLGQGRFAYDMVDSMPRLVDAYDSNKLMASRTRCYDLDSFAALVKWYACGKFSSSNCAYIDRNEWNEMMADIDCRVFQAFVWTE